MNSFQKLVTVFTRSVVHCKIKHAHKITGYTVYIYIYIYIYIYFSHASEHTYIAGFAKLYSRPVSPSCTQGKTFNCSSRVCMYYSHQLARGGGGWACLALRIARRKSESHEVCTLMSALDPDLVTQQPFLNWRVRKHFPPLS